MSDEKHEHSDKPEEAQEGHSHEGHDHDHGHDHGKPAAKTDDALSQLGVQRKSGGETEQDAEEVEVLEDSNTRALSEALSSSFFFVKILVAVLLVGFAFSCVRTVEPNEVAIILRFGKPVGVGADQVKRPGLHWAFPYPIDEVVKIPVGESRKAVSTAGWLSYSDEQMAGGDDPNASDVIQPGEHGYTLTSDLNMIHVRAKLNYRISDPVRYVLAFRDSTNVVENLLDNAIFYASAHFTGQDAISSKRPAFQELVKNRFEKNLLETDLGIQSELMVVDARAPMYVKPHFDQVLNAEQMRAQTISGARTYYSEALQNAMGQSNVVVLTSISRSNEVVQAVSAEASYFKDQLPFYERNPELFEQRLKIASLHRVLTNAQDKFYLPKRPDGKSRELRILVTPEPKKRGANPNQ